MKTDNLFYELFCYKPSLVFELIGSDLNNSVGYQFHSEEIKQTAFRIDGILTPPATEHDKPIVYIEIQMQPDEGFYSRFFSEIFLHLRHQKPQHPWIAVVIYKNRNTERLDSYHHYQELINGSHVHIVYLDDLLKLKSDNLDVQLLQLIITAERQAIEKANTIIDCAQKTSSKVELKKLLELIETIVVYKLPALNREDIQKMLKITYNELKKTQFYKDVFDEGLEQGMEQAAKREVRLILRLCEKYYGSLDRTIVEEIKNLSLEKMDDLENLLFEQQAHFTAEKLANWLFPMGKY